VTFVICLVALVLLQLVWCCRQNKAGFLASTVVSAVAALLCTVGGIIILVFWKDATWCVPFVFISDDDDYVGYPDYCNEGAWATVAFVCAALWFAVAGCLLHFVKSGRHAKWEEQLSKSSNNSDDEGVVAIETQAGLEMGTVQQGEHIATATTTNAEEGVVLSQVAAVTMITTDSYVPPGISDKVDDV